MARIVLYKPQVVAQAQRAALPLVRRTVGQILVGARRLAPRGDHRSGSGRQKPGRPLTASLHSDVRTLATKVEGRVGSPRDYAATVHQGSQPHRIGGKGRMLRFRWERGQFIAFGRGGHRRGRLMFYFRQVNHPGNKRPVRYLTTPMHVFGRRNGFVTSSGPVNRSRLP